MYQLISSVSLFSLLAVALVICSDFTHFVLSLIMAVLSERPGVQYFLAVGWRSLWKKTIHYHQFSTRINNECHVGKG